MAGITCYKKSKVKKYGVSKDIFIDEFVHFHYTCTFVVMIVQAC